MKGLRMLAVSSVGVIALGVATLRILAIQTEADVAAHRAAVIQLASNRLATETTAPPSSSWATVPPPVQRYFAYVFPQPVPAIAYVEMELSGQFRRPRTEGFNDTTAQQVVATDVPAFVFSAQTQMFPGIWAYAYDAYVNGEMEMTAKILSAFPVVNARSSPALDQVSLRRWLLESPLYPVALLPGGPVRWEAIDEQRARAIVSYDGLEASLVATFREDGSLAQFDAEADGDLTTPYHGSGEHVDRSDYQLIQGLMIPTQFSIARAAGGKIYPFWEGRVTQIRFKDQQGEPIGD